MSPRRKGTQWNRENRVGLIYKHFPALGTKVTASHRALRDLDLLGQIRSSAGQLPFHQLIDKGCLSLITGFTVLLLFQGPCHYHSQELALCVLSWGPINPGLVLLIWYIPWQWESCQGKWAKTLPACPRGQTAKDLLALLAFRMGPESEVTTETLSAFCLQSGCNHHRGSHRGQGVTLGS